MRFAIVVVTVFTAFCFDISGDSLVQIREVWLLAISVGL
jgi:hypothetical protein